MDALTGNLAALATAACFSVTSVMFTFAGRQLGSPLVNRARLLLAVSFVMGLHFLTYGQLFPSGAEDWRWAWLGLSGVLGLALGDGALFQALLLIGPRLSSLMMALAPVIAAQLAWIFLGETLALQEIIGMVLALAGVAWVISERVPQKQVIDRRSYLVGLLFGLGGAMGQASGLITSKLGLAGDFPALSGNVMRLLAAMAAIWLFTIVRGQAASSFQRLGANPRALKFLVGGTLAGPVLGVWLSLIAIQNASVGIASTLMSLTPIFLLPIAYFVFEEHISRRALVGTGLAFLGTALLFL